MRVVPAAPPALLCGTTLVLEVTPGPRALITEVRIEFKGDLAVDAPERRAHRLVGHLCRVGEGVDCARGP